MEVFAWLAFNASTTEEAILTALARIQSDNEIT